MDDLSRGFLDALSEASQRFWLQPERRYWSESDLSRPALAVEDEEIPVLPDPERRLPVDPDLLPPIDPRLVVIDWITARWKVRGCDDQVRGDVMEVWQNNERLIKRKIGPQFKEHESWSAKVQIKVVGGYVELSGNLNKWLHKHALFGISHPFNLICAWVHDYMLSNPGLNIMPESALDVRLSRIDLTSHIDLETILRADQFLSSLRYVLRARLPGEIMPGDVCQYRNTVYWGQHSRAWSIKFYNKYRELKRHWKKGLETLADWQVPESVIRVELTLRGPEMIRYWHNLRNVGNENLKRKGWAEWSWNRTLACANSWTEQTVLGAFMKFVRGRIQAFDNFASLPPANITIKDLGIFRMWQMGDPIDSGFKRTQYYTVRKRFKERYGIDLQRPPNPEAKGESASVVLDGLQKLRVGDLYVFSPVEKDEPQLSQQIA